MSDHGWTHFKMVEDLNIDASKVGTDLFREDEKSLVVRHSKTKKGAPPHWHFQGVLKVSDKAFHDYKVGLTKHHSIRQLDPKARPLKQKKEPATELGFQYMMKHGVDSVVYSTGFSPEELTELALSSEKYVQDMQADGFVYLKKNMQKQATAEKQHCAAKHHVYKMYREQDKMMPPNVSKLVVYWLCKWCDQESHLVDEMATYISERYM